MHILDNDCVALEVKYHRRCYERYTSCLRHVGPEVEKKYESCKYIKFFESFYQYVKEEIVDARRFIYMSKLWNKFVETVEAIDNEDASNCKAFRLKRRLQNRFPQLVFYQPRRRFTSEIVFAEDMSKGAVAERALNSEEQNDWDKMDSDEDEEEVTVAQRVDDKKIKLKELYAVALGLKENIRSSSVSWYEQWPPLASDLNYENVRKIVNPRLFNFNAWLLGYSDEPEECEYVNLDKELAVKVFSICQDLIYNSSRGRFQTPKSLALAMTVRQVSGCSGLINILHGLGHCVSLSSTMAFDTALAQLVVNTSDIIPREFAANKAVNLVNDNIDFGEDIKKQTHVTNGIITQQIGSENQRMSGHIIKIKKKQRTIEVPQSDVMPFSIGVRKTPAFISEQGIAITNTVSSEMAQKIDFAYVLLKIVPNENNILPGWTGFNTTLRKDDIPNVSRVGYLPVIDASPTEYSTINTILKRSNDIADTLQLQYVTLVFDVAVYSKVHFILIIIFSSQLLEGQSTQRNPQRMPN